MAIMWNDLFPLKYGMSISDTCEYEIYDAQGSVVAGEYGIEDEGFARLLTAAPDLFAALKAVYYNYPEGLSEEMLDMIEKALNRAVQGDK